MKGLILCVIFGTPIGVFILLLSWEEFQRKGDFDAGMERAKVYAIMGKPSNTDDKVIALWSSNGQRGKPWRELATADGIIAAFDREGRSINFKVGLSALSVYPNMSDEEVAAHIAEFMASAR